MVGHPLLETNHFRAARNASVVKSDTISKCAALVAKHTKTHAYALIRTSIRVCPFFNVKGPAKSMTVCEKGGLGLTLDVGSCPIICFSVAAEILRHVMHRRQAVLTRRHAPRMWKVALRVDIKSVGPACKREICLVVTNNVLRGSFPSRMTGCFCEVYRLELSSRLPTMSNPPEPIVGLRLMMELDALMTFLELSQVSSSWKHLC